jgi:23S rRNA (cytidine1920-2'-O)/16S rRNA (cytidine1409-2'-O)-methyltransferase
MARKSEYVSRGGDKLRHALDETRIDVSGAVCADLGANVGGFTHCLLEAGAARVYAVDTGYGTFDWTLRNDPRVVVMERTNALHVELPERVGIVTSDVAWTRQSIIVPAALRLLAPGGVLFSLFKPQYEAPKRLLRKGRLPDEHFQPVLEDVLVGLSGCGVPRPRIVELPPPEKGRNRELFLVFAAPDATVSEGSP